MYLYLKIGHPKSSSNLYIIIVGIIRFKRNVFHYIRYLVAILNDDSDYGRLWPLLVDRMLQSVSVRI